MVDHGTRKHQISPIPGFVDVNRRQVFQPAVASGRLYDFAGQCLTDVTLILLTCLLVRDNNENDYSIYKIVTRRHLLLIVSYTCVCEIVFPVLL